MAQLLHASTVAFRGRGVVILGASGSGKSALALELMALGAGLVADDRTLVEVQDGALVASCPPAISGRSRYASSGWYPNVFFQVDAAPCLLSE